MYYEKPKEVSVAESRWFEPRLRHEMAMQALMLHVRTSDPDWLYRERHVNEEAIRVLGKKQYGLSPGQCTYCIDELVHYQAPIERAAFAKTGCVPIPLLADGGAWQSDVAFDAPLLARLNAACDELEAAAAKGFHRITTHENAAGGQPTQDLIFSARYGFHRPMSRAERMLQGYEMYPSPWAVARPGDCTELEAAETFAALTESPARAIGCMGRCRPPPPTPEELDEQRQRHERRQARFKEQHDKFVAAGGDPRGYYHPYTNDYLPSRWQDEITEHAWIPCEVQVGADSGTPSVRILSYVPGLHPERHAAVYGVLEEALSKFVPLWELVLADTIHPREPRLPADAEDKALFAVAPGSLPKAKRTAIKRRAKRERAAMRKKYYPNGDNVYVQPVYEDHEDLVEAAAAKFDWRDTYGTLEHRYSEDWVGDRVWANVHGEKHVYIRYKGSSNLIMIPNPSGTREEWIRRLQLQQQQKSQVSLAGRRLQVVVRLATSTGTDDGAWHIDGMPHEHIVASGAVTISLENDGREEKEAPRIELRHTSDGTGDYVSHRDNSDAPALWGTYPCDTGGRTRPIGHAQTRVGRALAMANVWTHRVTAYRGRRRVLVFFLVDPWQRVEHSSGYVPPQDPEWARGFVLDAMSEAIPRMPMDLIKLAWSYLEDEYGWEESEAEYNESEMRGNRKSQSVERVRSFTVDEPDMSC